MPPTLFIPPRRVLFFLSTPMAPDLYDFTDLFYVLPFASLLELG